MKFCPNCGDPLNQNENVDIIVPPGMKACLKCTSHCEIANNFCQTCGQKFPTLRQSDDVTINTKPKG